MERTGRTLGSAAAPLVLAGIVTLYVHDRPPAPHAASVAVVSVPVTIARPTPAPSAVPYADPATVRQRPERRLVEAIATHDRRGGDVRMMATVMATQPHSSTTTPIEATMISAVGRLPLFAGATDAVHVTCVRTACEVAGALPPGQTEASMTTLFRDKDFERTLLSRGYTPGPVLVADAGDGQRGFVFYVNNEF